MDKRLIELRGDAVRADTRVWITAGTSTVAVPVQVPDGFVPAHFTDSGEKCADGTPIWTQSCAMHES